MLDQLPVLLVGAQPAATVELDVLHRLARPDARTAGYLDRLMGIFCGVAQAGGFWSAGRADQRTGAQWLSPATDVAGDLVLRVRVPLLDVRMWQCWRNMVGRLVLADAQVLGISLVVAPNAAVPDVPWQPVEPVQEFNEHAAYPLASPELMAVLAFEDNDAAKSRRFLIELDRAVQPQEVTAFESAMQPWCAMLGMAAFSLPVGAPHEEDCLTGRISQFDACSLELSVDRFRASEQAWLVLGNMAMAWWRDRARVLRMLVD